MINYKIEGFEGVALEIQSLDDKMKRSEILKILRRQMQPVVDKMKQNAPNQRTKTINVRGTDYAPQELKNAIKVKTSPSKKYPALQAEHFSSPWVGQEEPPLPLPLAHVHCLNSHVLSAFMYAYE